MKFIFVISFWLYTCCATRLYLVPSNYTKCTTQNTLRYREVSVNGQYYVDAFVNPRASHNLTNGEFVCKITFVLITKTCLRYQLNIRKLRKHEHFQITSYWSDNDDFNMKKFNSSTRTLSSTFMQCGTKHFLRFYANPNSTASEAPSFTLSVFPVYEIETTPTHHSAIADRCEFFCNISQQLMCPIGVVCDGHAVCDDASDEANCNLFYNGTIGTLRPRSGFVQYLPWLALIILPIVVVFGLLLVCNQSHESDLEEVTEEKLSSAEEDHNIFTNEDMMEDLLEEQEEEEEEDELEDQDDDEDEGEGEEEKTRQFEEQQEEQEETENDAMQQQIGDNEAEAKQQTDNVNVDIHVQQFAHPVNAAGGAAASSSSSSSFPFTARMPRQFVESASADIAHTDSELLQHMIPRGGTQLANTSASVCESANANAPIHIVSSSRPLRPGNKKSSREEDIAMKMIVET